VLNFLFRVERSENVWDERSGEEITFEERRGEGIVGA
jgi:hypothetical protein